ncbi:RNA polymerase sigma factor [Glacieibacterium megasporae]|uniref:RNA polymerase sigma factor n=1 Tax=Glacieibacterium megasporae TaxID=2835787 RepID=UPI00210423D5|nr:sigma-70 family RNA polymerase sigma factor [Polymorphobacter megasporae]
MRHILASMNDLCQVSFDDDFGVALAKQVSSLSNYGRRLTGGGADADDLLQDTMLRCWSARHSFRPDSNLGAWARTVMRNSFLSGRRRARFQVELPEEAFDRLLSVAENQSNVVALRDAEWALNKLTIGQREAVLLASQGVKIEDAAAQLAITSGTFKSRVWRGRLRLRQLTEEEVTPHSLAERKREKPPRQQRNWKGVIIG